MAKVYDALKRIERERQRQDWLAHWVKRRKPPVHSNGIEHLATRLDALERRVSGNVPSTSEVMLLERIEAIARRFDALEERVCGTGAGAKSQPVPQRIHPSTTQRLPRMWPSDVAHRLLACTPILQNRATGLLLVSVLLSLAFLFLGR